jgi:CO dehydrogenase maturation factor
MEASIEHLSRGTIKHAEHLLIVVEPYYRAMETAGRIAVLAPQLGITHVLAVANKVRTPDEERALRAYCDEHGLEIGCLLPFDDRVTAADRDGRPFLDAAPDSDFVREIERLADRLSAAHASAR